MKAYKILLVILALVVIAGTVPVPAAAQTQSARMTVRAAHEGNFKYGEWLLLWADIENPGMDIDAELQVRVENSAGGITYSVPVPLPSGARKRVPLYVLPNNFARLLEARLISGDTLLASVSVPVKAHPNLTYLIGLAAERRGALALLNGIELPGQERPRVLANVALDELPEHSEGLGSFDLLVLNNVDTSKLTPKQGEALQNWVEQGGRLVIGGGSGAQRTLAGLPASLRPVETGDNTEHPIADLHRLASFVGQTALPNSGSVLVTDFTASATALRAGDAALPLVAERSLARGSIDFVALDLAAAPFEGWTGTQTFWETLVAPGAAYPENMPTDMSARQMRSGSFYWALTNIPSLDLPSVRGLSILLLVYIILVGPVNYFLLRRFRKLHRAWVTIPVITVLFAAGAFAIGYAMRGNDLIVNKIAVVETSPNGPGMLQTYIGLFSPRRQQYVIEVNGGGLLSAGGQDYSMSSAFVGGGGISRQEIRFTQGSPALVEGLSVTQWSMQAFVSEDTWDDLGTLSGNLRLEGDVLKGTVKNDTRFALKDVVVVINRRYQKLGDLAVGQEAKVDLGLADMTRDWFGSSLGYRIYMESYQSQASPPRDAMQKQNILDGLVEGVPWSKVGTTINPSAAGSGLREVLIFGWTDQAPPDVRVRSYSITQMATTLVHTSIPINLDNAQRLTIPPGLLPGRLIDVPRGFGTCGPNAVASVWIDNASATFEFIVPPALRQVGVEQLRLYVGRDNQMAALNELAIFDWSLQGWAAIPDPNATTFVIRNGANYVGPNGEVRVRMGVPANSGTCLYVDLGASTAAGG